MSTATGIAASTDGEGKANIASAARPATKANWIQIGGLPAM